MLGAGILVDFLENTVFGQYINPAVTAVVVQYIPWVPVQNLFVGEYGIVTLGLTYGFGIILPIVSLFFIVFSILEDSGYLPRLALLVDNGFKKIGLSGRSVIPFVLAVGCGSMAAMVTRTLETKRVRCSLPLPLATAVSVCQPVIGYEVIPFVKMTEDDVQSVAKHYIVIVNVLDVFTLGFGK